MSETVKAYRVDSGDNEGHSTIVFANSNAAARRIGANEFDTEFEFIESCRRAPEFDGYAELGYVPPKVLIEHNWSFECFGCGERVTDIEYMDHTPVFDDRSIYCSQGCYDREILRIRRDKRAKDLGDKVMRQMVARRWPGSEVVRTHIYQHRGKIDQAIVEFKFPGSQRTAKYKARDVMNGDKTGMFVARLDLEAWHAYEDKILAQRELEPTDA